MKTPLYYLLLLVIPVARPGVINAQVKPKVPIEPKNVKVITQIDPALQIRPALPDCYILENRFWANETRSQKLVTEECYTVDNRFKWRPVRNADGSYYITSLFNTSARLVYEKSNIVTPRIPGINDGGNPQDGFYVKVPPAGGFSSSGAVKVTDKWWLRNISGYEYSIARFDRTDSFRIKLLPVTWVPEISFNYTFDNLNGWILGEGAAAGNAFAGQPSTITHIPFYNSPVIPPMPLGGSYWRELERDYHSLNTKTTGGYINTARPGNDPGSGLMK